MPSVQYSIDARGSEQGAARFSASVDKIIADATRAANAIAVVDKAMAAAGQTATSSASQIAQILTPLRQVASGATPARSQVTGLTVAMRDLGSASVLAFGPLSGIGSRFTAVGALAGRANLALGASIAVVTGVGVAFFGSVKAAADFEEAMIRVAKVTNDTPAQLRAMSAQVLQLSATLGVPATELAKIEQGAAQLGVRGSANLAAFAAQVGMLTRTTDLTAEAATNSLGRLIALTHESVSNVAGMAASLTALGNNSKTTESSILTMTETLARATAAFHVNSQTLLAVGGALADVGAKNQSSATALSQIFVKITQAAATGKDLQKFADVVGITADEFQRLGKVNPADVFLKFLGALAQQGPRAVDTLQQLHIGSTRNTAVMLSLGQVLGTVNRNLAMVADQYKNPTATASEFERMNDALNRQLEISGVRLHDLAISAGSEFVPPITQATKSLNDFLGVLLGVEKVDPNSLGTTLGQGAKLAADAWHALETAIIPVLGLMNDAAKAAASGDFDKGTHDLIDNLIKRLSDAGVEIDDFWEKLKHGGAELPSTSTEVADFTDSLDNASQGARVCSDEFANLSSEVLDLNAAFGASDVDKFTQKLRDQIAVLRIRNTQGDAAANTEQFVRDQDRKGKVVTDDEKKDILDLERTLVGLQNAHKGLARETASTARETDNFSKKMANETAAANAQTAIWEQVSAGTLSFSEAEVRAAAASDSLGKGMRTEAEIQAALAANKAKATAATEKEIAVGTQTLAGIEAQIKAYDEAAAAGLSKADADLKAADALLKVQAAEKARDVGEDRARRWLVEKEAIDAATDALERRRAVQSQLDETSKLQLELQLTQQVNQGLITELDKKIAIARQQAEINHQSADEAEHQARITDAIERENLAYIHLGSTIKDSLSQVGDALISGTLKWGEAGKSFGLAMGKRWVEGMIDSKLHDFDPTVKANFLDLAGEGNSIFKTLFSGVSDGSTPTGGTGGINVGGFFQKAINWVGGLFSSGTPASNLPTSYVLQPGFVDEAGGFQGPPAGDTGGWSFGSGVAGAGIGFSLASLGNSLLLKKGATGLNGILQSAVEPGVLSKTANINLLVSTVLGAVLGPLGGLIGGVVSNIMAPLFAGSVNRGTLLGHGFGGLVGAQQYFDPASAALYGAILGLPTLGTALRRGGESIIDSSKIFGGEDGRGGLQGLFGDWTRTAWKTGPQTALDRGFTPEQIKQIEGMTQALFGTMGGEGGKAEHTKGSDLASLAEQQGQIMAEFLSRGLAKGLSFDELFANLGKLAQESGITLMDALNALPKQLSGITDAAKELGGKDQFTAAREGADSFALSLYGISKGFADQVPQGVSIAEIALQELERNGTKAFENLDDKTKDWLRVLANNPEEFRKQVADLASQGFTIDTAEFKNALADISASASFIGGNLGDIFTAPNMVDGIDALGQKLKDTVTQAVQASGLKDLFNNTRIAESFQGTFGLLRQLDAGEIKVTDSDFALKMAQSIAEGKATLEDYIPELRAIRDAAKDVDKTIEDAFKPTDEEARWTWLEEQLKKNTDAAKQFAGSLFDVAAAAEAVNPGSGKAAARAAAKSSIDQSLRQSAVNLIGEAAAESVQGRAFARAQTEWEAAFKAATKDGVITAEEELKLNTLRAKLEKAGEGLADSMAASAEVIGKMFSVQLENARQAAQDIFGGALGKFFANIKDGKTVVEAKVEFKKDFIEGIFDSLIGGMQQAMVNAIMAGQVMAPLMATFSTEFAKAIEDGKIDANERSRLDAIMQLIFERGGALAEMLADVLGDAGHIAKTAFDYAKEVDKRHGVPSNDRGKGTDEGSVGSRHYTAKEITEFAQLAGIKTERDKWTLLQQIQAGKSLWQIYEDLGKLGAFDKDATREHRDTTVKSGDAIGDMGRAAIGAANALNALAGAASRLDGAGVLDLGGSGDGRRGIGSGAGDGRAPIGGRAAGGPIHAGTMAIVGERGPELFIAHAGGGASIIPLGASTASMMLGHGVAGYAMGAGRTGQGGQTGNPRGGNPRTGGLPSVSPDVLRLLQGLGDADQTEAPGFASAVAEALKAAFEKGKDFAADFAKGLGDDVNEQLVTSIIKGFTESRGVRAAEENIQHLIDGAEKLAGAGKLTPENLEKIREQIKTQTDYIEKQAKDLDDLLEPLRQAQTIAKDIGNIDFGGLLKSMAELDFSDSGAVKDWAHSVRDATKEAVLQAVIDSLLLTGPLKTAIDAFSDQMSTALKAAFDPDGPGGSEITKDEAKALAKGARLGAKEIRRAMRALEPVFEALGIHMTRRVAKGAKAAADIMKQSLSQAFSDPTKRPSFAEFMKILKTNIYEHLKEGLIQAFVDSALIQGALAPMLGEIQHIFDMIAKHQIETANANSAIAQQIALMLGVLNDPAFQQAFNAIANGIAQLANSLGQSAVAITDAGDQISEAGNAAEQAECTNCELEQRLARIQLTNAALDVFGRGGSGYLDVLIPEKPPVPDTASGGDGGSDDDIQAKSRYLRGVAGAVGNNLIDEILKDHPSMSRDSVAGLGFGLTQGIIGNSVALAQMGREGALAQIYNANIAGKWFASSVTRDELASWLPGLAAGGLLTRPQVVNFAEHRPEVAMDLEHLHRFVEAGLDAGGHDDEELERRISRVEQEQKKTNALLERLVRAAEKGGGGNPVGALLTAQSKAAPYTSRTRARTASPTNVRP